MPVSVIFILKYWVCLAIVFLLLPSSVRSSIIHKILSLLMALSLDVSKKIKCTARDNARTGNVKYHSRAAIVSVFATTPADSQYHRQSTFNYYHGKEMMLRSQKSGKLEERQMKIVASSYLWNFRSTLGNGAT